MKRLERREKKRERVINEKEKRILDIIIVIKIYIYVDDDDDDDYWPTAINNKPLIYIYI